MCRNGCLTLSVSVFPATAVYSFSYLFLFFWWWWIWNHAVHYTKRIDSWLCEGALLARYDSLSDNFIINYCVYRNFFLFSQIIHPRLQSQPSQCNDSWLSTIHLFKCASDFSNGIINIPTKQGKNKTDPRFSTPHKLEGGSLFLYNLQFQYALHDKINRIAVSLLRTLWYHFVVGFFAEFMEYKISQMKLKSNSCVPFLSLVHCNIFGYKAAVTQCYCSDRIKDINNSKSTLLSAN